ncbi:Transposase IS200 like protein [Planctomycetes bacterium CA13]|uniref:Transposase IS200 like protein n=1 Tax=Novipirellula herctigrandis TaxID=2527986 RepID=A0A5C5Z2G7_9BACT|nr:Transposase IS200 like protein [Planctomycetes bacterium CA13]
MSTFHCLNYHVTFSTKHRTPWIKQNRIDRLHAYLGGTVNELDGRALKIAGVEDHIHLLIGLKPVHKIADFMRELKKSTSKWVHEEITFPPFQWQEGYAIFSVSPTVCPSVAKYIANQYKHHRKRSYREELIQMLEVAGIKYNPKYLD